jgi:hypothetical protein
MTSPPLAFLTTLRPFADAGEVNVFTLVGLPPTPCGLARFLLTALARSPSVMAFAFDLGTHLGYLRFDPLTLDRPHA